jgi:hypothetical protein
MKQKSAIILTIALLGCGNANEAYKERVAQSFMDDCKQPAPTPKLAKELDQLCSCTVDRIRSSDIAFDDTQEAINAKIQGAMETCSRVVYGEEQSKR